MAFGIDDALMLGGSLLGGIFGGGSKQTNQNSSSYSNQSGTGTSDTSGATTGSLSGSQRAYLPPELQAILDKAGGNLGPDGLTGVQGEVADWLRNNMGANSPLATAYGTAVNNGANAVGVNNQAINYLQNQQNNGSFTLGKYFGAAPTISAAQSANPNTVIAGRGADFAGSYATPLQDSYVNSALNDYDTGVDRGFNALRAKNAGAFGNNRTGVENAVYQSDAARGRGNLSAQLNLNAFNTAAGYGMSDADRAFAASGKNADLGQSNAQFNAGLTQAANMFNSNLEDSRQKFDIGQATTGENTRLGVANSLLGAANNLSGINATNLGNASAFNSGNLASSGQLGALASLSPQQLAQLAQMWGVGVGSDTTGTSSGTSNSTTNNSFSGTSNSNSTGTATQPGDPFGTMAQLLMAGGYAKKNGLFG